MDYNAMPLVVAAKAIYYPLHYKINAKLIKLYHSVSSMATGAWL